MADNSSVAVWAFGILCTSVTTEVLDRTTQLVSCKETGWEGLWSTTESGTMAEAAAEHKAAHSRRDEAREYAWHRANALSIYRSTEPGNPARRGIGAYL